MKMVLAVLLLAMTFSAEAKKLPGGAEWSSCTDLGAQAAAISQNIKQGISFDEMQEHIYAQANLKKSEKAALLGVLGVLEDPRFLFMNPLQFGLITRNWCESK